MVHFLHLFPKELSLNGETGNLTTLMERLRWSGVSSSVTSIEPGDEIPQSVDAVFIGSGSISGMRAALRSIQSQSKDLRRICDAGVPFFAVGYGWELLGESIRFGDGEQVLGAGIFPSKSIHDEIRVSRECFGFDEFGNLTTGYANHSGAIELLEGATAMIQLEVGEGNGSEGSPEGRNGEGLVSGSLMATRLNGPILPMNPHLADRFIRKISERSGFSYSADSEAAKRADGYAEMVRKELRNRLTS